MQIKVSEKANKQIRKLKLEKQKNFFLANPLHPSLDFKQLKGIKGFYAFRINNQYRARLLKIAEQTYFILVVGRAALNGGGMVI